ncbi:MAG: hypothetical protein JO247_00070 [Chloroflexi bacterium]|nr:hypothetical protein [Chloroflexota bacterium]
MHALFERALGEGPIQAELLVALCDWRLFFDYARRRPSGEVFARLDEFYLMAEDAVDSARGLVLKFMGDAALAIFPAEYADPAIMACWRSRNRPTNG